MTEEKKKLCPNCGDELLKLDDTNLYCQKEDLTFTYSTGKMVFSDDQETGKGRLQQIEEEVAEQRFTLEKIIKKLFGKTANNKEFWE